MVNQQMKKSTEEKEKLKSKWYGLCFILSFVWFFFSIIFFLIGITGIIFGKSLSVTIPLLIFSIGIFVSSIGILRRKHWGRAIGIFISFIIFGWFTWVAFQQPCVEDNIFGYSIYVSIMLFYIAVCANSLLIFIGLIKSENDFTLPSNIADIQTKEVPKKKGQKLVFNKQKSKQEHVQREVATACESTPFPSKHENLKVTEKATKPEPGVQTAEQALDSSFKSNSLGENISQSKKDIFLIITVLISATILFAWLSNKSNDESLAEKEYVEACRRLKNIEKADSYSKKLQVFQASQQELENIKTKYPDIIDFSLEVENPLHLLSKHEVKNIEKQLKILAKAEKNNLEFNDPVQNNDVFSLAFMEVNIKGKAAGQGIEILNEMADKENPEALKSVTKFRKKQNLYFVFKSSYFKNSHGKVFSFKFPKNWTRVKLPPGNPDTLAMLRDSTLLPKLCTMTIISMKDKHGGAIDLLTAKEYAKLLVAYQKKQLNLVIDSTATTKVREGLYRTEAKLSGILEEKKTITLMEILLFDLKEKVGIIQIISVAIEEANQEKINKYHQKASIIETSLTF